MKSEYIYKKQLDIVLSALMPQNALILRVAYHTGLRIGDVLRLKPEQLSRQFWVVEQKTKKKKRVGLPDKLRLEMLSQSGEYYVFENRTNVRFPKSRQAVYMDLKRAAKAFRLPQQISPHSVRKLYAVEYLAKCHDVNKVQKALNHDSPAVTMLYCMADMLLKGASK